MSVTSEVNAVSGAEVFPELEHAVTDRFTVPEQPRLEALEADAQLGLGLLVAQRYEPIRQGLPAVAGLVPEDLNHAMKSSSKATNRPAGRPATHLGMLRIPSRLKDLLPGDGAARQETRARRPEGRKIVAGMPTSRRGRRSYHLDAEGIVELKADASLPGIR